MLGATKEQFDSAAHWEMERMQKMDAYIAIRGSNNVFENSDLPPEDMKLAMKSMKAVLDWRVKRPSGVFFVGHHLLWHNRQR